MNTPVNTATASTATQTLQTSLQNSVNLYSLLEQALRKSSAEKMPITARDLYLIPSIRAKAKNVDQLRSALESLKKREFVLKQPIVDATGDKMARVGYSWNLAQKKPVPQPSKMMGKVMGKEPVKPAPMKPPAKTLQQHFAPATPATQSAQAVEKKASKEIELVYEGVQIVIGKNPVSGRLRIVIEDVV